MKKILAVVLALVLCMALCAVGSAADKYKVGILAPAVTHGWVAGVAYNAEQECLALADEVDYKLYTSNNAEEMTTQLDDLMTWGAQAIVAFPQWEGMEVPIQNAIDSGITVVNFDIVIDADGVYRVTGDNEGMGVESAKYIVEKIGTTGTVVALPVPTSGSVSELRMKGFTDTIKEIAPEMNVIEYATAFTRWITAGGSHHTCMTTSVGREAWEDFARIAGVELAVIDENTTARQFEKELELSEMYHRLNNQH